MVFTEVLSPCGMSEGDVVPFRPASKHLFLCNKAVVVSSSTAFILYVCYTFIRPPGLVVVVGHLLRFRFFSSKRRVLVLFSVPTQFVCGYTNTLIVFQRVYIG